MGKLDRQFATFASTGDAGALAAVFDATAEELVTVAHHLLGDAATAEDCVQETFLSAIESAATFDATRRVMPWLVGILTNRCRRRIRERAEARVAEEQSADHAAADRHREPDALATAEEFRARLDTSLAGIAEPYRSVLQMRLHDDLSADAIAVRLAKRPSTVRTQLQRGMERLRAALPRTVLPAGACLPVRGIEGVRESVLSSVPAGTAELAGTAKPTNTAQLNSTAQPAGTATATAPGIKIAAVLLCMFTLLGVFLLVGAEGDAKPSEDAVPVTASKRPKDAAQQIASTTSELAVAERSVVPPQRARADETLIFGLCVERLGGAPVSGCTITLTPRLEATSSTGAVLRATAASTQPVSVSSAEDGSFVLRVVPTQLHSYTLEVQSAQHLPFQAEWRAPFERQPFDASALLVPGTDRDLGVLRLLRGHRVRGRVTDAQGLPVGGVQLWASMELPGAAGAGRSRKAFYAKSAADGGFAFERALPSGNCALRLRSKHVAPVELPTVRLVEGEPSVDLACVVRVLESITGVLLDPAGQPLAQVPIRAIDSAGSVLAMTETSKLGGFALYGTAPRPNAAVRVVPKDGAGWLPFEPAAVAFFGRSDLRLVGRRVQARTAATAGGAGSAGAQFRLRVVDALSQAPIETYAYRLGADPRMAVFGAVLPKSIISRRPRAAPGGVTVFSNVTPGPRMIFVDPSVVGYACSGGVGFSMPSEDHEFTVELSPLRPLELRVTTAEGQPAVGAWVELIARDADDSIELIAKQSLNFAANTRAGRRPAVVDCCYTDALGRAALQRPGDIGHCVVRVAHHTGREVMAVDLSLSAQQELQLGTRAGSAGWPVLRGRLVPADALAWPTRIVACRPGERPHVSSVRGLVASDGGFTLQGLPDGDWEFRVLVDLPSSVGEVQEGVEICAPLARRELRGAREQELVLAIDHLAPARLRGSLSFLAHAAAAGAGPIVWLECIESRQMRPTLPGFALWSVGRAQVDSAGSFSFDAVPPGRYRLAVRGLPPGIAPDATGAAVCAVPFVCAPRAALEITFDADPEHWKSVARRFDAATGTWIDGGENSSNR